MTVTDAGVVVKNGDQRAFSPDTLVTVYHDNHPEPWLYVDRSSVWWARQFDGGYSPIFSGAIGTPREAMSCPPCTESRIEPKTNSGADTLVTFGSFFAMFLAVFTGLAVLRLLRR